MPDRDPRLPKYRHYKPKNLAVVRLDGRGNTVELSPSELIKRKPVVLAPTNEAGSYGLRIKDLILAFWTQFAKPHYHRSDGTPTGELDNDRDSLRPLRRLLRGNRGRPESGRPTGWRRPRRSWATPTPKITEIDAGAISAWLCR